jgi:hypothetical protein
MCSNEVDRNEVIKLRMKKPPREAQRLDEPRCILWRTARRSADRPDLLPDVGKNAENLVEVFILVG